MLVDTFVMDEDTLVQKIGRDVAASGGVLTAAEVGAQIFDVLRYTMTFPESKYSSGCQNTIQEMRSQGMTLKVVNYWTQERIPFQGVTIQAINGSGTKFELHLHTTRSFEVKMIDLRRRFGIWQASTETTERDRVQTEMFEDSKKIPIPSGVASIV